MPLPHSVSPTILYTVIDQIPADAVLGLEERALSLFADLQTAQPIRTPSETVSTDQLTQLNDLIDAQASAEIDYQRPRQATPSTRTITPQHIEQRGRYYYLIARCHNANATRTFRLDRIRAIRTHKPPSHPSSAPLSKPEDPINIYQLFKETPL